ncbi:MAG: transglutaminase domain-containing protein [Chitinophagaceae bacterium]|nr:MAG: transglutaminase domain-containing protein [Chitinophagaceae bacterium]
MKVLKALTRAVFVLSNRRMLIGVFFLAAIFLSVVFLRSIYSKSDVLRTEKVLRFNYTFSNTTNEVVKHAEIGILIPINIDGLQSVRVVDSTELYQLETAGSGQRMNITLTGLAPYASKIVGVTLVVSLDVMDKSDKLKSGEYLQAAPFVETQAVEIKHLAASLKVNDRKRTAENVFNWLLNNIKNEGYTPERKGALFVINKRVGDCTEFMYAFVALMRANGIPARGISGYFLPRPSSVVATSDRHDWAEFYDGTRWVLVDAEKKNFDQNIQDYVVVDMTAADIATNYLYLSDKNIQARF